MLQSNSNGQFLRHADLLKDQISSYDIYPFSLPVVSRFARLHFHPKVTFLVGENGAGKSTLLEAIAISLGFNSEGGTQNFQFSNRASHSELHKFIRLAKGVKRPSDGFFFRAESFFNLATEIERLDSAPGTSPLIIDSYGGKSIHEQSHGESFMSLILNRFGQNGLYILDEPEAALSPQKQLSVLARIHALVLQNSQFIIATHSPILMSYPDAKILVIDQSGLTETKFEETEHYLVMKQFLMNPKRMHELLFQ